MGAYKDNPRYNVVSCRVTDQELQQIRTRISGSTTITTYLLQLLRRDLETK